MPENQNDRQLEALLDSLLSIYSRVEPRPGLELRIRARLKARAAERRRLWWIAFAASAAAIFLAAWLIGTRSNLPDAGRIVVRKTAPVIPSTRISANPPMVRPRTASPHHVEESASKTRALLLVASVAHTNRGFVLQKDDETSDLPASLEETRAPEAQKPSSDAITIQDLGVDAIDVKELTPRSDEKGDLR